MNRRLLVKGGHLIDPGQGMDQPADLLIAAGRVVWLGTGTPPYLPDQVLDATNLLVTPGFIDLHCHLREPGFEAKETIATATRAAARGGFTTLCAMPNTNPPADAAATVEFVMRRAQTEGLVRVLPIACITRGRQGEELAELGKLAAAGAVAFSDDGSPVANPRLFRHALEYSLSFNLPVMEHCEDLELSRSGVMNEGLVSLRLGLQGIPAAAEEVAVARNLSLVQLTGGRLHLCHLSTAGAVELVRRAKAQGIPVTAEVTPHHLTLTDERVRGRGTGNGETVAAYDTNAKVNPPLRTPADLAALLQGLKAGVIDAIATDHAPHTAEDKLMEFDLAPFGFSGLETALASLLTLVHRGELDLPTLIARLTLGPARIIGRELGMLKVGAIADVVLFSLDREWVVDPTAFASKGRNTPLAGERLRGKVMATIAEGRLVYQDETVRLTRPEPSAVGRLGVE